MNKTFIFFTVLLLIAACSPTPTPNATSVNIGETQPPSTSIPLGEATPASESEEPIEIPSAVVVSDELWLQVLTPLDEAILDTPQVDVIGTAPDGTVLSVNDEIMLVGEEGSFKVTVLLDEGPNLIEIVASNVNGGEVIQFLSLVYEP